MSIDNLCLKNESIMGNEQTWIVVLAQVMVNAPPLKMAQSFESCSFENTKVQKLLVNVNGIVGELDYTPGENGAGTWALAPDTPSFSCSYEGANLSVACKA